MRTTYNEVSDLTSSGACAAQTYIIEVLVLVVQHKHIESGEGSVEAFGAQGMALISRPYIDGHSFMDTV